jgi:hypothetical protein
MDKKAVSSVSTHDDDTMTGKGIQKHRCIKEYNMQMSGADNEY